MLQVILTAEGRKLLLFYDSGCSGACIADHAYQHLDTQNVSPGPTRMGVAGGGVVQIPGGEERFWLPLDKPGEQATFTGLHMPHITSRFPDWELMQPFNDLQAAYLSDNPAGPDLPRPPESIGGCQVHVMLGIRYVKYFPKPIYSLPCGLTIYEGQFKSPKGQLGVLGGTHKSWRSASSRAQFVSPVIFLTNELRAYRMECDTLNHLYQELQHVDEDAEVVDLQTALLPVEIAAHQAQLVPAIPGWDESDNFPPQAEEKKKKEDVKKEEFLDPSHGGVPKSTDRKRPVPFPAATSEGSRTEDEDFAEAGIKKKYSSPVGQDFFVDNTCAKNHPFVHCAKHRMSRWVVPMAWDLAHNVCSSQQDLDNFENVDRLGSELSYRCIRCRNCADCRKGDQLEHGSFEGEVQQALMERCVELKVKERRLEATLPFIMDPKVHLAPNKPRALKVLESQLKKATKNPQVKEDILAAHNKLLDKGHVSSYEDLNFEEKKCVDEPGAVTVYIPWSIVTKLASKSTPYRMVFNGSSVTKTGHSLNSVLAKGENKLPKILTLLLSFASKKSGFTADVSMAYNSVKLKPSCYNFQRYLWQPNLDPQGPVVTMFIKTLIYGIICSGGMTAIAFALVARFAREHHPEHAAGAEAVEAAYVDDAAYPADTLEEAKAAAASMDFVLDLADMKVKAYTFAREPPDEKVSSDGKSVGLLGYLWWPLEDLVSINVKELFFGKIVRGQIPAVDPDNLKESLKSIFTRRTLVAKFASVFDPLGLATPITARVKLDLSVVTDLKLGWDNPLPLNLLDTWVSNLEDLQDLKTVMFNRSFIHQEAVSAPIELLVAVDASATIAMAVVYGRTLKPDGSYSCRLIVSKSKLVHLTTVPRGELRSAVLGATLAHLVRRVLGARWSRTIFVTDSQIVLFWMNQDSRPLLTAVRNAVIEIRRLSEISDWRHIDSKNNPADIGTRDAAVSDIGPNSEWQLGKWWMTLPENEMPLMSLEDINLDQKQKQEANKEIKAADICGVCLPELKDKVGDRYSFSKYVVDPCTLPWKSSVKAMAYVFRFINKLKTKVAQAKASRLPSSQPSYSNEECTNSPPGPRATPEDLFPRSPPNGSGCSPPLRREKGMTPPEVRLPSSRRSYQEGNDAGSPLGPGTTPEDLFLRSPPGGSNCSPPLRHEKNFAPPKNFFSKNVYKVAWTPPGFVSCPPPLIDESKGIRPVFPSADQCPECPPPASPPHYSVVRDTLEPNFPSHSPPVSAAHVYSNLRPEAESFVVHERPQFPALSTLTKSALLDFQLSKEEITAAERYFFIKGTKEVKQFAKKIEYKNCSVFKDGLLRFSGRILDGQLIADIENIMGDLRPLTFCQPMLDRYSPVAYAIMIHAHQALAHHRNAIASLRESRLIAYVIKGRDLANEIRDNCPHCCRFKARLVQAEMGKIHQSRLTISVPFYFCQVDLFGPFLAFCEHNHRSAVEVYGCVFKCPSSGAIAVYAMEGHTTGAFIHAYIRHSSRYGHPLKLFIDAAGELVKACKDLLYSWTDITSTLNGRYGVGIEHVVVNTAEHSAHGVVERSILEVKRLFKLIYRNLKLDLYSYETAFSYIANELNSLPLCLGSRHESIDKADLITPSRLMLGRNNKRAPSGYPRIESFSRQVKQMDDVHKAWWAVWKDERIETYVPAPSKWHKSSRPPVVGDIVVFVKEERVLGDSIWKLGRISRILPSAADGIIRSVIIEYKNAGEGVFQDTKRSVRRFAILYREGELALMDALNEAAKEADIALQVQLNHDTVHRAKYTEAENIASANS